MRYIALIYHMEVSFIKYGDLLFRWKVILNMRDSYAIATFFFLLCDGLENSPVTRIEKHQVDCLKSVENFP